MSSKKSQHLKKMEEMKKRVDKKNDNTAQPNTNTLPEMVITASPTSASTANNTTQPSHPDVSQASTPSSQETTLRQEIEELKTKNIRLMADMQNVMRQHEMNILQARKSTKKEISLSFVDFVSNMNLAFSFTPANADKNTQDFIQNLKNSLNKSLQTLTNYSIEIIVPKPGEPFNPEYMTGINEPPEGQESPLIQGVVSVGLKIENQIIKPAVITF